MKFTELSLNGAYIIEPNPFYDERGYFMRTYAEEIFEEHGLARKWVHENQSRSERKGIIRGLHFQFPPYSETKLIRVIRGSILDVFVDLRKDSATFGKWEAVELSEENKKMVFIPRGFAHGFCTMSDIAEIAYKVDNYYSKEHECGVIWNDKDLDIKWKESNPFVSEKDSKNITLSEFCEKYGAIEL